MMRSSPTMSTSHEVVSRALLAAAWLILSASGCQPQEAASTSKPSPVSTVSSAATTATGGRLESWEAWDGGSTWDRIGALSTATGVCTCYKIDRYTCLSAAHCFLHCP